MQEKTRGGRESAGHRSGEYWKPGDESQEHVVFADATRGSPRRAEQPDSGYQKDLAQNAAEDMFSPKRAPALPFGRIAVVAAFELIDGQMGVGRVFERLRIGREPKFLSPFFHFLEHLDLTLLE